MKNILKVILLMFCVSSRTQSDVVLIANTSTQQKTMSRYEVQSIFMLKQHYWKNGMVITPIFVHLDDRYHHEFVTDILRLNINSFNTVIDKCLCEGYSNAVVVDSFGDAIAAVNKISGAITYIPSTAVGILDKTTRVVNVVD